MRFGFLANSSKKFSALVLSALFASAVFAAERDFTTLFPAVITAVRSYEEYEVEFQDIYPEGLSERETIRLVGIKDVEKSEGEDFLLYREQMEGISVYVLFDRVAGIYDKNGTPHAVILYIEDDDLFEETEEEYAEKDQANGSVLYEMIGVSCRLVYEGIALADDQQKLSPHIQFLLDLSQVRRNKEIDDNAKKKN